MDDSNATNPKAPTPRSTGALRSPIRPVAPPEPAAQAPSVQPSPGAQLSPTTSRPDSPRSALEALKQKMSVVVNEFAEGKINRAQFNAIYGRYSEQRSIIERLIERNPTNNAWEHVAAPGHTSFLRSHFEARTLAFIIFRHNFPQPLMMGGKQQINIERIAPVLKALWSMASRPKNGLARKAFGDGQWLVLAMGEHALTIALFSLEPSTGQANLVRDLHADFERANRMALARSTTSLDRLVFPQRALIMQDT